VLPLDPSPTPDDPVDDPPSDETSTPLDPPDSVGDASVEPELDPLLLELASLAPELESPTLASSAGAHAPSTTTHENPRSLRIPYPGAHPIPAAAHSDTISTSFATVFQLRIVVGVPSRASRYALVSFERATPLG
jgi:hypothetical protein